MQGTSHSHNGPQLEELLTRDVNPSWRLAWYLATALCERYYASHGLSPRVISHEGFHYYGIGLFKNCTKLKHSNSSIEEMLGRLSAYGNIENWKSSDQIPLSEQLQSGVPVSHLLSQAINCLQLPMKPKGSHTDCVHRWEATRHVMLFNLIARLAMSSRAEELVIHNHPHEVHAVAKRLDPKYESTKSKNYWLIQSDSKEVLISGSGRVIQPHGRHLWEMYLKGAGYTELLEVLKSML